MKSKHAEAWNFMEVYIIYTTTYVCKQRVVALLLMELLSKMRKMRTITPPDAILRVIGRQSIFYNHSSLK